jgi:hypothetical protein
VPEAQEVDGLSSVAGLEDVGEFDSGLAQGALDDLAHDGGVVDDEGAQWDVLRCRELSAGR